MELYLIFIIYIAVMSLVTFITYGIDKRRAIKKQWRIKESVLLGMALLGGAVGAILAMYGIRHKNRKWYFVAVNFISLILYIGVVVLAFMYA